MSSALGEGLSRKILVQDGLSEGIKNRRPFCVPGCDVVSLHTCLFALYDTICAGVVGDSAMQYVLRPLVHFHYV